MEIAKCPRCGANFVNGAFAIQYLHCTSCRDKLEDKSMRFEESGIWRVRRPYGQYSYSYNPFTFPPI